MCQCIHFLRALFIPFLLCGVLFMKIVKNAFCSLKCVGPSMLPTLSKSGDVVLQEKLTPRFGKLEIGDVVILTSPTDTAKNVCKRITGLAGDTMVVRPTKRYMREKIVDVPPGHAYLEGDNPMNSTDSRNYGPVPLALITGRVFMKIWPVWDAGWIRSELPSYTIQNYRSSSP